MDDPGVRKGAGDQSEVQKILRHLVGYPEGCRVEFVQVLQEELILVVPGSGFGGPGYFRIAFCASDDTIKNAMPGFRRAMEKYR